MPKRPAHRSLVKALALHLLLVTLAVSVGCQQSALKDTWLEDSFVDKAPTSTIADITALYQAGDVQGAYDLARPVAADRFRDDRFEAAYLAGLSAQQLGQLAEAERLLILSRRSTDPTLEVDAADALGSVYAQLERYNQAKTNYFYAAERLTGERQAQAYFYAAIAQQKLGQASQARTTLVLARSKSTDPALRQQINDRLEVTGWTLQLGAFTDRSRARGLAQSVAQNATNLRLGLPRLVPGTTAEGQPVTLVHVGQFTTYQTATRYRDALGQTGVLIRAMRP